MSAEAIRIINAAISRNNGNTITSVDDGTPEAIFADLNYEQMAETALVESPWKFARKSAECVELPTQPCSHLYHHAWMLPDDVLKLRTLTVHGEPTDYVISDDGDQVWTRHHHTPLAVYTFRAPEALWPPDFVEGLTGRLEACYLRLDERESEAMDADKRAENRMGRARLAHSQEEATHEHKRFPLIRARLTGYAPLRRF